MAAIDGPKGTPSSGAGLLAGLLGVGVLLTIFMASRTHDPRFMVHAYIFMAAFTLALAVLVIGISAGRFVQSEDKYEDGVIRAGVIASLFWGVVGMLVGVVIASQLSWPNLFYFPELGWLNFGRLRPLHTSAVIFAFGGNVLIAT